MKSITVAAFIAACCNFSNALAQDAKDTCSPSIYKTIKRDLKLEKLSVKADESNVISSACKSWPYRDNLLLAAFAYDEDVEAEKKQVVAVVDNKKKRVVSSQQQVIGEDPMTEFGNGSLKIDTARYRLNDDVKAFGMVFVSRGRGPNCGDSYWGRLLTLYIPNEKKLEPLLSVNLWSQQWLAGCPASATSFPSFWENADLTLSMANSSTNGFRDIVVSAKITVERGDTFPSEFKNRKNRTEKRVMKFDGKTYKSTKEAWWLGNF